MNKLLLLVSCLLFATAFALTQSEQQQIVSQHNHIRSNVSPVPVQALKNLRYSAALEKEAVKVASQCSNAASTGRISGENLFFAHGDRSDNVETLLTSAVASWEAEKAHFTLTASKAVCEEGQECEHYTQMIWESTSEIGCDFQVCQNNSPWGDAYPTWTVFVCHYSSRGNTLNQLPYENTNESPLASRSSIDYANDFVQTIPQQTHDFVSSSNQVTLFAHGEHVLRWESSSALIDPTATTQVQTIAEIGKGSFGVVLRHGQGADRENDGIYWIVNRVGRATSQLQLCMRTFGEVTCDEERSVRFPSSSVLVTVQMAHNPIDNTLFTSFQIGEQQAWTAYVSSEMFPYTGAIAFIMTPPESTTNPSISAVTLSTVAKVSISLNQCLNEFQLSELFSELHSGSSLVQWTPQNDDCRMVELTIISDFASALAKAREFVSSPLSSDIIFAQVVEDDAFANVEKDILIGSRWYQSSLFFTTHTKVEYIVASPESTTSTGSGLGAGSIAAIVLGSVLGGVFCCCLLLVLLLLLCLAAALARGKREVTPVVPVTQAVPVVAVQAVGSNAAGAHSNVAGRAAGSPAANGSNHYEYH